MSLDNRNLLTTLALIAAISYGLIPQRGVANDHDLDPPSGGPTPQTKPYTLGPRRDNVAGGINPADEQIIDNQEPPGYLNLNRPVDLPALLNCALERNPLTTQVWAQAKADAFALSGSKGAYWPTLQLNGSAVGGKYNRKPDFPGFTRDGTLDYAPELQLQFTLLDFGARAGNVDAARFSLLAADLSINGNLQTICAQVTANYYNLLLQDALLNLAAWQVDIAERIQTCTYAHEKSGFTSRATDQEQDQKAAYAADQNLRTALLALANAHGIDVSDPVDKVIEGLAQFNSTHEKLDADVKAVSTALVPDASGRDYKMGQADANLVQTKYALEVQQKARDLAAVALLNSIGLPVHNARCLALTPPPGYQDDSNCEVPGEKELCVFAQSGAATSIKALPDVQKLNIERFAAPDFLSETRRLLDAFGVKPGSTSKADAEKYLAQAPQVESLSKQNRELIDEATSNAFAIKRKIQEIQTGIAGRRVSLASDNLTRVGGAAHKLIDLALRRRPDIAIQYASLKQNAALARVAYSNLMPSLTFQLSGSTDFQNMATDNFTPSNHKHNEGFGRTDGFAASIGLSFTIFDGFLLWNKFKTAQETVLASRATLANSELGAISDVVTDIVTYEDYVCLYYKAKDVSDAAGEALAETEATPTTQLGSYLDAINAQTTLFAARVQEAQAAVNVLASAYILSNSTGMALRLLDIPQMRIPTIKELKVAAKKSPPGAVLPNHK